MDSTTEVKDPLTWLPIPLATGTWLPDENGDLTDKIENMKMVATTASGKTVELPVTFRGGGWRAN